MTDNQKKLFAEAALAQKQAYAPYSKALIGASVLMKDGQIFSGCNVENASYGATVCAERVALWKAISASGSREILEVLVISDADQPWPPCGMCRQVIAEFANQKTIIYTANLTGKINTFKFTELFPESFTADFLK